MKENKELKKHTKKSLTVQPKSKMNQIKFSKEYRKLHRQKFATLLKVTQLGYPQLHADLIEYDTRALDGSYYPLPKTMLLHLTFLGDKEIPFCTIRRHTTKKWGYYKSLEGQEFKIIRTWEEG